MKCGITGELYNVIKSMYNNTEYRIRINDLLSPPFGAQHGVKQGCCMSPLLSNIYQNDLHDIFTDECDPVTLSDSQFNSISWADDLLIISKSKQGLQNCLNNLNTYCTRWGLDVNINKTKTMVMCKMKWAPESFTYGNLPLECVKVFNYLGFQISYNASQKYLINERISKANKMANMALRAIRTNKNVSTRLALSIFDKQILPILLYVSSIWSLPGTHNNVYLLDQPENKSTRVCATKALSNGGVGIPYVYARRVGKKEAAVNRKILIRLNSYSDKLQLLTHHSDTFKFTNYDDNYAPIFEKVHTDFFKTNTKYYKIRQQQHYVYGVG